MYQHTQVNLFRSYVCFANIWTIVDFIFWDLCDVGNVSPVSGDPGHAGHALTACYSVIQKWFPVHLY